MHAAPSPRPGEDLREAAAIRAAALMLTLDEAVALALDAFAD